MPPEVVEVGTVIALAPYREPPEADLRLRLEGSGGWVFNLRLPPEVAGGF